MIGTGQDESRGILSVTVCLRTVLESVLVVWRHSCCVGAPRGQIVILIEVDWNGLGIVQNDTGGEKTLVRRISKGQPVWYPEPVWFLGQSDT